MLVGTGVTVATALGVWQVVHATAPGTPSVLPWAELAAPRGGCVALVLLTGLLAASTALRTR